jgi:Ni/Co efflux regulator RcnB
VQAGQQWRQQHQRVDRGAVWRSNRDWWRQDAGFRLFSGVRIGFFFVPEVGYVSAPRGYWGRQWRAGDVLPRWFWRYEVRDFWRYGLPAPPNGCAWVWVNDNVALIDLYNGYILDIVYNVF